MLVMQSYEALAPLGRHYATAEAGFDALCERLSDAGGASASAADAMTDRVAAIAQRVGDEGASSEVALAMLLEVEIFARTLPASFAADATPAERAARELFAGGRGRGVIEAS